MKLSFTAPVTLENSEGYNIDFIEKEIKNNIRIITCNLSDVKEYDSFLILLLNNLSDFCKRNEFGLNKIGITPRLAKFIEMFGGKPDGTNKIPTGFCENYFSHVGQLTLTG
ncbi:MAG: hypothetical protein HZB41_15245, partial [Ignavibacteriae bacterium]|nr:hypothetical protein [Ignavibacteriota bacterium]